MSGVAITFPHQAGSNDLVRFTGDIDLTFGLAFLLVLVGDLASRFVVELRLVVFLMTERFCSGPPASGDEKQRDVPGRMIISVG